MPARPTPPCAGATALVAEDDTGARAFIRQVLSGLGFTVLEAEDGPGAVRAAEAHAGPIELLVSDVLLPGFGGGELAAQLKAARPALKVLYLSGYDEHAVRDRLPAGAPFLSKPFHAAQLQGKVRDLLAR